MDLSAPQFTIKVTREGTQKGVRVGVDVDAKVTDFSFEDAEKTHKLSFSVDNFDLRHFDDPIFKQGDLIEFAYGYVGEMSPPRQAVVTKVTGGTKLKVEALGKDYLMNKVLRVRAFENVKRSDVVRQIAQENGYSGADIDIEESEETFAQITQARMSDLQLCRELARKEGKECFADATGFHWHERRVGTKPTITFTYYTVKPDVPHVGMLLAFPNVDIDVTAKPGAVTVKARDPLKKKDIKEKADNQSTAGRDLLASVLEVVDETTGKTALETRRASEVTVASTATTQKDAAAQAKGAYKAAQNNAVKFKVSAVGNPYVSAKTVARFEGIGKRLSGAYFLATVTHKIGASYTMDIDARRNGTNSSGTASGATANGKTNNQPSAGGGAGGGGKDLQPFEVVDEVNGVTRVEWR